MVTALSRVDSSGQSSAPLSQKQSLKKTHARDYSTSKLSRPAALPDVRSSRIPIRGGLDGFVLSALQPIRLSPELLEPDNFQQALKTGRSMLENASQENLTSAAGLTTAARVLGDEIELRSLMAMYRSSLLQG